MEAIANNEPFQRPLPDAEIRVPIEIGEWKRQNPTRALSVQSSIAEQFDRHFRAGLAVTAFDRDEDSGTYLLSSWE